MSEITTTPTAKKKIIFSGIQPTGVPTIGNYLGALKNWVELQDEYNSIFSVVDLHAITVRQDPQKLREASLNTYALLLACGVDVKKSILFMQSHVAGHAELAWILSCYTQFGELSRMTQFKDKSKKHAENINAGLFTYPSLMAADILLYNTDVVPIGVDQKQHLELARNIAGRFNALHGNVFKVPEPYIGKVGAKIMSLQDPTKKMSKSDDNVKAFISILDKPETIIKRCKSAVTDSDAVVAYRDGKDGVNNLMTIYSVITDKDFAAIETEFSGIGYGTFKQTVGEALAAHLTPIRTEFDRISKDKAYLEECYTAGAEKAVNFSNRMVEKVFKKVGFIAKPKF